MAGELTSRAFAMGRGVTQGQYTDPIPGYLLFRAQQQNGTYVSLNAFSPDASRLILQGKAA